MTDFSMLVVPDKGQDARNILLIDSAGFADWLAGQPVAQRALVRASKFAGAADSFVLLPAGEDFAVIAGVANAAAPDPWSLARLGEALPEGHYRLASPAPASSLFGWLIGQHVFDRYKQAEEPQGPRIMLVSEGLGKIDDIVRQAEATALVRDLVNTPAADMGPDALEAVARDMATTHGAEIVVTTGDALENGYPMIHGVGKAAMRAHAPRLIEIIWGNPAHPRIAIVGKGVTFDTGGLNMKTGGGMALMKKDMGGAAHALGLAQLVMGAKLPVRLHLLVPAAENAIDNRAMRPGDILNSRKGLTVEITNTDAEGRLVLGDALTRAGEDKPELIIDFATLTGAARVALGPDLPVLFSNDDALADGLLQAGTAVSDPCWRLPLWPAYDAMLASPIADCMNSASGGFAGSITAALFLQKFVPDATPWAHFDTFAWEPNGKAGHPKGGDALGLRASYRYLCDRFGA
ncbi:MAG: leucyl aminopeptidase family protein [Parasphingorhabdus sp.]|nr:leucyl aminopeptidase family protein [Parasphingorhabdus sp.]